MKLKKAAAAVFAAMIFAASAATTVCADYDNNYDPNTDYGTDNGYTQSDTSVSTAAPVLENPPVSAGNEVTSVYTAATVQTTTTLVPDKPTSKPATIKLDVGEVKNGEFKVKVKIDSESLISNASFSISYDTALMEYVSYEPSSDAGGMAVENCFDGKFVYNYVNKDGSEYDGTYVTLKFRLLDENMISSVLYLSVTSLDDNNLIPISYFTDNGIVTNGEAETTTSQTAEKPVEINIPKADVPVELAEFGIENIEKCTVKNGDVLLYQNGAVLTLEMGSTEIEVTHTDGSRKLYIINVVEAAENSGISSSAVEASAKPKGTVRTAKQGKNSLRNVIILGAVTLAVILIIVEYIVIMKPFGKKAEKPLEIPEEDEQGSEEMRAELEKAIAAKNAASRKARGEGEFSETAQINKELVAKGFILTDDSDDDE
ncbi:MAG: hypothetical protein J5994_05480 [Ruminococcus sp.]|nr:hypothetical protein [Ruminococcus sp.]